ncbi:DUF1302 family protein [Pseudomonas monachiensis]|uniref:DUF1302 family protein n=1 Tax=Pseudomonas monachiensis TaxID=3060212 RepID=A0ABW9HA23_9PSED
MLDYYAYGTWDVSGHALNARLGNQVVSRDESLFYPGICAAQSPLADRDNVALSFKNRF